MTYDGTVVTYPNTQTNSSEGVTYTYSHAVDMVLDKDGTGIITQTYTYSSTAGDSNSETYANAGSWAKVDGKQFSLAFAEPDLNLSCTLDDGELDCAETGTNTASFLFAPAE